MKAKKQIQFYWACWVQFDDYMLKKIENLYKKLPLSRKKKNPGSC